ncbi:MAG: hemerythrin domain-containing protein [Alphaproteobacteria bacterium]|nr:hemerythrin domain-containing protein [Alphaproteobacteria bacterium]
MARIDVTAAAENSLQHLRPADLSERFRDPLGFIYTEHYRNRIICNTLDSAKPAQRLKLSTQELEAIVEFYTIDRPLHLADEEESLFPLLRKRCKRSDNLPEILALLEAEHRSDQPLIDNVIDGLLSIIRHGAVADPDLFAARCRAMSDFQRRHLAWENSVVMPLAKKRLSASDLVDLGRAMAERRGITLDSDG